MRKSFTLLELLIVVIILAILATFAVPQYLNAVERTKISKACSALKLILKAEIMYRAENNNYLSVGLGGPFDTTALGNYLELVDIDNDIDWNYRANIIESELRLIARRVRGPYQDSRLRFWVATGEYFTTHPLGGCN